MYVRFQAKISLSAVAMSQDVMISLASVTIVNLQAAKTPVRPELNNQLPRATVIRTSAMGQDPGLIVLLVHRIQLEIRRLQLIGLKMNRTRQQSVQPT